MKRLLILTLVLAMFLVAVPANADDPTTWLVDDDGVECPDANFTHPQDAVNAANPGDTILVCPGIYSGRRFTSPVPPHWGPGDQYAPALIVYKDGLTIKATDSDPSKTVIQTTYNFWVNPAKCNSSGCTGGGGSIEHSTGCIWNPTTKVWDDDPATPGDCVRPTFGTPPNGVTIIANNVTVEGFTILSTYPGDNPSGYPNTAGAFVGALYAGDRNAYGISGTTIRNCVVKGHSGVRIWKAPNTTVEGCTIYNDDAPIGIVQPALEVWDGYLEGPNVGSTGLQVLNNEITTFYGGAGISLGGYYNGLVDHSNLFIDGNTINSSGHGVTFWGSGGASKVMTCNNTVNVPAGKAQVVVSWGTYDGPYGLDGDHDGVTDCDEPESCWGSVADAPTVEHGINHWLWNGSDWITVLPKGKGPEVDFTIEQTHGCSCFQILATYGDPMEGHYKFGCSPSVLEEFIASH